ncbi:MAG: NapC/NirT family cytochrome c, partial [Mycobacteriaceae bacterium]
MSDRDPTYRPPYRPQPDPTPEPPVPSRPRRGSRHLLDLVLSRGWIVGVLLGLAALLIVVTAAFAVVNNNEFCGRCHVIKKEVVSFTASSHHHPGVNCQDCHTKPGVFNYFIRNLQSATHVVEYISGRYQRPIVTYVGVENCVTCHPKSQIERDVLAGNIRVNHTGLREAGYQCMTCHSQVVHGDVTPVGSRAPESTMHICWRCHNGVIQSQRCSICHVNGVPPGTAAVKIPVHMSQGDCTGCHDQKFCAKCHNGLTMPHPAG